MKYKEYLPFIMDEGNGSGGTSITEIISNIKVQSGQMTGKGNTTIQFYLFSSEAEDPSEFLPVPIGLTIYAAEPNINLTPIKNIQIDNGCISTTWIGDSSTIAIAPARQFVALQSNIYKLDQNAEYYYHSIGYLTLKSDTFSRTYWTSQYSLDTRDIIFENSISYRYTINYILVKGIKDRLGSK